MCLSKILFRRLFPALRLLGSLRLFPALGLFGALRLFGALLSVLLVPGTAFAEDPVYTGYFNNLAVSGYDTVAYFTEDNAIKGSDDHEYEWQGAIWRFSNADNLATFIEEPEKYAPQFGGYCAWAVSQNKTASADPKQFHLEDGKLYLNYNANIQQQWLADRLNLIKLADQNWPKLVD